MRQHSHKCASETCENFDITQPVPCFTRELKKMLFSKKSHLCHIDSRQFDQSCFKHLQYVLRPNFYMFTLHTKRQKVPKKNYKNQKMCCCVSSRRKPTKTLVKNSIRAFLCFTFNIYYYHHCRLYNFTRMRPKSSDLRHFLSKKAANLPSKTHIIKQLVQVNLWPTLFEKLKEGSLKKRAPSEC